MTPQCLTALMNAVVQRDPAVNATRAIGRVHTLIFAFQFWDGVKR